MWKSIYKCYLFHGHSWWSEGILKFELLQGETMIKSMEPIRKSTWFGAILFEMLRVQKCSCWICFLSHLSRNHAELAKGCWVQIGKVKYKFMSTKYQRQRGKLETYFSTINSQTLRAHHKTPQMLMQSSHKLHLRHLAGYLIYIYIYVFIYIYIYMYLYIYTHIHTYMFDCRHIDRNVNSLIL